MLELKHVAVNKGAFDLLVGPGNEQLVVLVGLFTRARVGKQGQTSEPAAGIVACELAGEENGSVRCALKNLTFSVRPAAKYIGAFMLLRSQYVSRRMHSSCSPDRPGPAGGG